MKKLLPFSLWIFFFISYSINCQTAVLNKEEIVSWNDHYIERTIIGDSTPGTLIIASESSDVKVASLLYDEVRTADIYYPTDMDFEKPRAVVILVSGDSDQHSKDWSGRALKDTDQYLQWGQVIAEHGLIAITYELSNPQAALNKITNWVIENSHILGIDDSRIGFFSTNENGCKVGLETIIKNSSKYTGPKPVFSIYYYGMMQLYSSKELYLDVPIMTVKTKDFMYRGIPESMDKFNKRAKSDGALITIEDFPEGKHYFDCKEDNERSREILKNTLDFMMENI